MNTEFVYLKNGGCINFANVRKIVSAKCINDDGIEVPRFLLYWLNGEYEHITDEAAKSVQNYLDHNAAAW